MIGEDLHRGLRRRQLNNTVLAYILILPSTFITFLFGVYPVVSGLWESLQDGNPIPNEYVGLEQYLKGVGNLIYIIIAVLSFFLCYIAYHYWQTARQKHQDHPNDPLLLYLIPSFFAAFGLFGTITLLLTGGYHYTISLGVDLSVVWIALIITGIGVGGYFLLGRITQGDVLAYVFNTLMVMLLTLLAVLMIRYAFSEINGDIEEAREIASLILNTDVGNASPLRPIDGVEYVGVELAEAVPVQVEINGDVFEAMLAPNAYEQIEIEELSNASFTLGNNQKVDVVMPLSRGLGFGPVDYFYDEATLILESSLGNLDAGPPSLEVPIILDDPSIQAPFDIYVTAEVGDLVVAGGGYTTPADRPLYAALAVLGCLGAIYIFGVMQDNIPLSESTTTRHERLGLLRKVLWVVIIGLAVYIVSHIQFYRNTAQALQTLSLDEFRVAYQYVTGENAANTLRPERLAQRLLFLPQILMISAGAIFVVMAYMIWNNAKKHDTTLGMFGNIFFATFLMVGGWLFISELPNTIMLAGDDAVATRDALVKTALYSIGTVPIQLALGMGLAYLMFYEVSVGKSMFRLFYFMPYIAPQIATATVFTVIFKARPEALANQFLGFFGIKDQLWLQEGSGLFRVGYEILGGDPSRVPAVFQGPSLALLTVILFNIWVYAGYNAVIFLAGLGSIPGELYEAAKVDGAGRWAAFRNITFPLLSPVTFFLSMLGIIGTFKAFGSVYVLRVRGNDYVDTITIRIFKVLQEQGNKGYAASLAFVLFAVILLLTLAQNRLSRDRVFYG
jgi:multiple sugar transport system permease protein